jgi:hypothetical protein
MLLREVVASEGDGKPVRKTTVGRTFQLVIYRHYAVTTGRAGCQRARDAPSLIPVRKEPGTDAQPAPISR